MQAVGVIEYLNALPFVAPYLLGALESPFEWLLKPPHALGALLEEERLKVSFVSSFFYLKHKEHFEPLSGIGISAEGPVESVALFYPKDLKSFEGVEITLDPESATSNALFSWYFKKVRREEPRFMPSPHHKGGERASSFLLIGDRCLHFKMPTGYAKMDLGELWREATGLPLPFALLVAERAFQKRAPELCQEISSSLLRGISWSKANPDQLAKMGQEKSGLSLERLTAYWQRLSYSFGRGEERALLYMERELLDLTEGKKS